MPINIQDLFPVHSSLPNAFAFFLFGNLVGSSGFEPPTLRLSGARSNHLSYEPVFPRAFAFGGDEGIRTPDPLLAGQVLSQLSYTPLSAGTQNRITTLYSFLSFRRDYFFFLGFRLLMRKQLPLSRASP